jgi:porin|tara:strand:- start:6699 stop:7790 length:1092 start_codon:yes stop_codon:yes gene_type:complete
VAQTSNEGIVFEGAYTLDLASNINGGLNQGVAYLGNIDLNLTFDSEKLGLWKGGRFYVYLLNNHGDSLSELMGDFQIANNIEADSNSRLYEFWYQHQFKNVKIILGQHNLNSIFLIANTKDFFINSSFGIQPDISSNVPTSIFPLAGLGGIISINISPNICLINGFYDGDPGTELSNPNSLKWSLSKTDGVLFIHELSYNYKKDDISMANYKLGFWNHTQNKTYNSAIKKRSQGVYFIGNKKLTNLENHQNGLSLFTQIGFSLNKFNPVKSYWGSGIIYKGFFENRKNDTGGIALAHTRFSTYYQSLFRPGILRSETAIEFSYEFIFLNSLSLKPNIQYIINPGSEINIPNALMALVRISYSW